jgi:hypothetical protein
VLAQNSDVDDLNAKILVEKNRAIASEATKYTISRDLKIPNNGINDRTTLQMGKRYTLYTWSTGHSIRFFDNIQQKDLLRIDSTGDLVTYKNIFAPNYANSFQKVVLEDTLVNFIPRTDILKQTVTGLYSTVAGAKIELITMSVAGASVGDVVQVQGNTANDKLVFTGIVTAADTVKIYCQNNDSSNISVNTLKIIVYK